MGTILAARESSALAHGITAQPALVSGYSPALAIGATNRIAGAVIATRRSASADR